jgi:hypothetical protein
VGSKGVGYLLPAILLVFVNFQALAIPLKPKPERILKRPERASLQLGKHSLVRKANPRRPRSLKRGHHTKWRIAPNKNQRSKFRAVRRGIATQGYECVGDCNWDGQVNVNELVTSVNIALNANTVDACYNADANVDDQVTINELIGGVNAALNSCDYTIPTYANAQAYYHGGPVLHTLYAVPIFWGPEWNDNDFAYDKIEGLDSFFYGFDGSDYAWSIAEYDETGASSLDVQTTYDGYYVDDEVSAPSYHPLSTDAAFDDLIDDTITEACYYANQQPAADDVYFLYGTTPTAGENLDYCAFHAYGYCENGNTIQVAYMPNIEGDLACDPDDQSTDHSQGLASLANVTAHELVESVTNLQYDSWFNDYTYGEVADMCNFTFAYDESNNDFLTYFNDGTPWKLQTIWSNYSFLNDEGYYSGPSATVPDLAGCYVFDSSAGLSQTKKKLATSGIASTRAVRPPLRATP